MNKPKEALLKRVLVDICRGYTYYPEKNLYVKHLKMEDQVEIDYVYEVEYEALKAGGVPTKEDLQELYSKDGEWTKEKENRIEELDEWIDELKQNRNRHMQKEYKEEFTRQIKEAEEEQEELKTQQHMLFESCCESIATKRLNDSYILLSFFKDKELTQQLYSPDLLDNLTEKKVSEIIIDYNNVFKRFVDYNIRCLAVSNMFQSQYRLAAEAGDYFGRPVFDLSFYQNILGNYGNLFKNIFSEHAANMPKEIMNDPDRVMDFVNNNREYNERIANKGENTQAVGWTSEDYKNAGISRGQSYAQRLAGKDNVNNDTIAKEIIKDSQV